MYNLERKSFDTFTTKRVSFILNTKNRAALLRIALQRHSKLIKPEDELIIIDGNSTDQTAEVINEYADIVDTFISEPDANSVDALNKGILLSRGKYIKQISDDDEYYPEAMEQAIQVLEEHPEVDFLVCGGMRARFGKGGISPFYLPPGVNYGKNIEDPFKYSACGVGFVIRRRALAIIGLFNSTDFALAADNQIVLSAIRAGANVKFCRINLFLHIVYDHSVGVSRKREWLKENKKLLKQYCSFKFYGSYYLRKWVYLTFILWLLQYPKLFKFLKKSLDFVRKLFRWIKPKKVSSLNKNKTSQDRHLFLWDRGFS